MEYKYIELLSCQFEASPDDYVRSQVSYRYNLAKARAGTLQVRTIQAWCMVGLPALDCMRVPIRDRAGDLWV